MYKGLRQVLEMSNDTRISDRQFRCAIQHMIDNRFAEMRIGFEERLKILRQEAVIETERDEYNRIDEEWSDVPAADKRMKKAESPTQSAADDARC